MSNTGASATPSPYRVPIPVVATHPRSEWDKELWDELANVIFINEDLATDNVVGGGNLVVCSVSIPCPVKCRLEVTASAKGFLNVGTPATIDWSAFVRIDGIDTIFSGNIRQDTNTGFPVTWFGVIDAEPGTRVLDIILRPITTIDFTDKRLRIRRGRTPVS